jgi:hypothetical protein
MVNICESVIKIVTMNMPKRLTGMDQKVCGQERMVLTHSFADVVLPVDSGHLTQQYLGKRNVETPYISL